MFAMSGTLSTFTLAVATGILIAGVVDDLRSRKFHNWLFLICTGVGFTASLAQQGWGGMLPATLGFFAGALILLPMVLTGIIGAGDMKLLAAFGTIAYWPAALATAVFALFWGAVFGLTRAVLSRQAPVLARNMMMLIVWRKADGLELNKIPYTVALLFGWLSYLSIGGI